MIIKIRLTVKIVCGFSFQVRTVCSKQSFDHKCIDYKVSKFPFNWIHVVGFFLLMFVIYSILLLLAKMGIIVKS